MSDRLDTIKMLGDRCDVCGIEEIRVLYILRRDGKPRPKGKFGRPRADHWLTVRDDLDAFHLVCSNCHWLGIQERQHPRYTLAAGVREVKLESVTTLLANGTVRMVELIPELMAQWHAPRKTVYNALAKFEKDGVIVKSWGVVKNYKVVSLVQPAGLDNTANSVV